MISHINTYSLIFFLVIIHVHSQGDILGSSACECFGMNNGICGIPDAPVNIYPKNCSSFLYNSFSVQDDGLVDMGEQTSTIKGYLDQLISTNIPVLVYYFHLYQQEWCAAVQCETGQTADINNIKSILDKHSGVKGIILYNLLDASADMTSKNCPDYTKNFKNYIDLMRKTFPKLSFGIHIFAKRFVAMNNNPNLAWLDYHVLDPSVDFYIINFSNMNNCTDEFTKTGIYPLTGNNNNTVDSIKTCLDSAGVSSTKVHYSFYNYGYSKDVNDACYVYPFTYCKNASVAKTAMCGDTLQSLYEKGAYANKNGAGFVVATIDSDDFDCSCQCGQSFPGFYALMNGFKGGPPPAPCALYDRT